MLDFEWMTNTLKEAIEDEEYLEEPTSNMWPKAILSLLATIYGSSLVVANAIELAELFGISSIYKEVISTNFS